MLDMRYKASGRVRSIRWPHLCQLCFNKLATLAQTPRTTPLTNRGWEHRGRTIQERRSRPDAFRDPSVPCLFNAELAVQAEVFEELAHVGF